MVTVITPGHGARSTDSHFQQFPQRDEAQMTAQQPEIGFSNSDEAKDAPVDVHPEVAELEPLDPGYTNDKAAGGKRVESDDVEDKAVKAPAKKAAKKAARKG